MQKVMVTSDLLLAASYALGATRAMSNEDLDELRDWEKEHLGSDDVGTLDWPGWERFGLRYVHPTNS